MPPVRMLQSAALSAIRTERGSFGSGVATAVHRFRSAGISGQAGRGSNQAAGAGVSARPGARSRLLRQQLFEPERLGVLFRPRPR